jgi:hypothetical protein
LINQTCTTAFGTFFERAFSTLQTRGGFGETLGITCSFTRTDLSLCIADRFRGISNGCFRIDLQRKLHPALQI